MTARQRAKMRFRCCRSRPATSGTSNTACGWSCSQASAPGRSSDASRVSPLTRASTPCTCAAGSSTAVSDVRRRPPGAVSSGGQDLWRGPGQQPLRETLAVTLPHPAAGGELVVVAGHTRRRQLVDVGEQQLGELRHRGRRQSRLGGRPGQPAPAHPGADAVRRQQRIHRATLSGLASTQGVRPLERGPARCAGVAVARPADQLQEATDRHLHGRFDVLAQRVR